MLNLTEHLPRTPLSKVVMLNLIQHLPRMPFAVIKQIVIPEGRCRGSPFCLFPALTPAQALTYETDVGDSPQKPWGMT
ncbi:MAG: hypothetical protein J6Y25_06895, partial [Elusimicrobiaceae bacterium]|nr:hypothetical protein [Elusimicrobiaceae bacterium]